MIIRHPHFESCPFLNPHHLNVHWRCLAPTHRLLLTSKWHFKQDHHRPKSNLLDLTGPTRLNTSVYIWPCHKQKEQKICETYKYPQKQTRCLIENFRQYNRIIVQQICKRLCLLWIKLPTLFRRISLSLFLSPSFCRCCFLAWIMNTKCLFDNENIQTRNNNIAIKQT